MVSLFKDRRSSVRILLWYENRRSASTDVENKNTYPYTFLFIKLTDKVGMFWVLWASILVFCFDFNEKRGKSCKNVQNFKMIEIAGNCGKFSRNFPGAVIITLFHLVELLLTDEDAEDGVCEYDEGGVGVGQSGATDAPPEYHPQPPQHGHDTAQGVLRVEVVQHLQTQRRFTAHPNSHYYMGSFLLNFLLTLREITGKKSVIKV